MFKTVLLIGSFVCASLHLYGIIFRILNMEKNECQMTYMFDYIHYTRINFKANSRFPKYGLYSYTEGVLVDRINSGHFNGAPVIFIPGNAGSYKQVRSLASVALRKSIDTNWAKELDYFTIDLNEEFSGIFGGHLKDQREFVKLCIRAVLNLYRNLSKRPEQVVLIGHSMGGKIAQSLLMDSYAVDRINTILMLATPIDEPVVSTDSYIDLFYQKLDDHLKKKRSFLNVTNETNFCRNYSDKLIAGHVQKEDESNLDKKLLISIGGGNRDILVHEGLTHSKFSDIHVLTTSIPKVWVSTDHQCIVWCLQLVLVINRFLFSIITPLRSNNHYTVGFKFIEDKFEKLENAKKFFLNPSVNTWNQNVGVSLKDMEKADWYEDSRRTFSENFPKGTDKIRIQMIRLLDDVQYSILTVRTKNINIKDWIFGCSAIETLGMQRFCSKIIPIPYTVETLPSTDSDHHFMRLPLKEIKDCHVNWTHLLLYIRPSRKQMRLNIDIQSPGDRQINENVPTLYSFDEKVLLDKTVSGAVSYSVAFSGLDAAYRVLSLTVAPVENSDSSCSALVKICSPWNRGSEKYSHLTKNKRYSVEIYSSTSSPVDYNITAHPVVAELHLNPNCIYRISFSDSFGGTISRIVELNSRWIPSYLTTILLLALQSQILSTPKPTKKKLHVVLLDFNSFLVLIGARVVAQFLSRFEILPSPDKQSSSFFICIIMYGTSVTVLLLFSTLIRFAVILLAKLLEMIVKLRSPLLQKVEEKFLLCIPVFLVVISTVLCGGLTLCCTCIVYLLIIAKKYESNTVKFVSQEDNASKNYLFSKTKKSTAKEIVVKNFGLEEKFIRGRENTTVDINIHITFLLILVVLTLLNIPSTISWFRNFKFAFTLRPDPSLKYALFSIISLGFIWNLKIPRNIKRSHPLYCLLEVCALLCCIYCQDTFRRLNDMICFVFCALTLSQVILL